MVDMAMKDIPVYIAWDAERAVADVNARISPAVIERVTRDGGRECLRFSGRWGTLRFEFILNAFAIQHLQERDGLPRLVEYHATKAVEEALHALVDARVASQIGEIARQARYAQELYASTQASLEGRLKEVMSLRVQLELDLARPKPWYSRWWGWLTSPL